MCFFVCVAKMIQNSVSVSFWSDSLRPTDHLCTLHIYGTIPECKAYLSAEGQERHLAQTCSIHLLVGSDDVWRQGSAETPDQKVNVQTLHSTEDLSKPGNPHAQ